MRTDFVRWGRMAAGAAALALLLGWTSSARADFAYAYSEQSLTGLRISGATLGAIVGTTTTSSNTLTGFTGNSLSDPVNTPQAYSGIPGAPAQDLYTTKFVTTFVPGPAGVPPTLPAGAVPTTVTPAVGAPVAVNNFSRGDAAYTSGAILATALFGSGINVANVAEAYSGGGTGTGNGGFIFSANFTAATAPVTVAYSFANDLFASVTTPGSSSANASFQFTFNVKNAAGTSVFDYALDSAVNAGTTNSNTGAPPNGVELISSGTVTPASGLIITGLTAGQSYTITFSGQEQVSVFAAAIPAPTSIVMLGLGLGGVGLVRFRNRRVAG